VNRILPSLVLLGLVVPSTLGATLYRYPLADPAGDRLARRGDGQFFIIHVDHDPAPSAAANLACLAFDGAKHFPNCYDAHTGTDYLLDGAFEAMDAGSLEVVAAADGVVVEAVDGNYDRCHADPASQGISCDGHPIQPNYVALEHADGRVTLYYHLKQGSALVTPGDLVACGQPLGLVGSSGISSTPHLHFQVEEASGAWIDPYAGPQSQPQSLWVAQDGPYGIPGAWCEGDDPILPEPEPEEIEALPEVVEIVPEAVDAAPEAAPEAVSEAVDAAADVAPDAVSPEPFEEAGAPLPEASDVAEAYDPGPKGSFTCHLAAGTTPGSAGPGLLLLVVVALSRLRGSRRLTAR